MTSVVLFYFAFQIKLLDKIIQKETKSQPNGLIQKVKEKSLYLQKKKNLVITQTAILCTVICEWNLMVNYGLMFQYIKHYSDVFGW